MVIFAGEMIRTYPVGARKGAEALHLCVVFRAFCKINRTAAVVERAEGEDSLPHLLSAAGSATHSVGIRWTVARRKIVLRVSLGDKTDCIARISRAFAPVLVLTSHDIVSISFQLHWPIVFIPYPHIFTCGGAVRSMDR